ncbi:MBL fold metallo-hydrolase [Kitasatospora sp. NPDC057541]|uniref:MBL fold metallo-hydrolase n=1 Tax=unclassified Kitasatospora TaxID=2633591 RepID=UPI0036B24C14
MARLRSDRTPSIRRLDLGYFVRPAEEAGGPEPRVEPVPAYLVRRPEGLLLFDTGLGEGDPEADARYRPVRRPLTAALAAAGVAAGEVDVVVNCHLHFDHCGGNPLLAGVPVWTQAAEPAAARAGGYTIDALVDFPGVRHRELDGEAEVWPGVRVVPTPGHTPGHQSLVVTGPDGCTVLAGQAFDTASGYGSAVLARRAAREGAVGAPLPGYPAWLDRLTGSGPRRVLFAHDHAVWEPGEPTEPEWSDVDRGSLGTFRR